ncbi:Uncharacterised protein [Escherichia coli]|nr:Uncharacterised protein [Escherichia coli]SQP54866.1 Uncharacterised protein [Escherichia coli]
MMDNICRHAAFNYASGIHHVNAIAQLRHHGHIMADEQNRSSTGAGFMFKQTQYLQLHRDVQRRSRFVGNNQLRLAGECQRNHYPLAHTT